MLKFEYNANEQEMYALKRKSKKQLRISFDSRTNVRIRRQTYRHSSNEVDLSVQKTRCSKVPAGAAFARLGPSPQYVHLIDMRRIRLKRSPSFRGSTDSVRFESGSVVSCRGLGFHSGLSYAHHRFLPATCTSLPYTS